MNISIATGTQYNSIPKVAITIPNGLKALDSTKFQFKRAPEISPKQNLQQACSVSPKTIQIGNAVGNSLDQILDPVRREVQFTLNCTGQSIELKATVSQSRIIGLLKMQNSPVSNAAITDFITQSLTNPDNLIQINQLLSANEAETVQVPRETSTGQNWRNDLYLGFGIMSLRRL